MARRRIVGDFLRELVEDGDGKDERLIDELRGNLRREPVPDPVSEDEPPSAPGAQRPTTPAPSAPTPPGPDPVDDAQPGAGPAGAGSGSGGGLVDPFEVPAPGAADPVGDAEPGAGSGSGGGLVDPFEVPAPVAADPVGDAEPGAGSGSGGGLVDPFEVPAPVAADPVGDVDPAPRRPPRRTAAEPVEPDPPPELTRGVDGRLTDADGNRIDEDELFVDDNGHVLDDDNNIIEVREPVGTVGALLFDADGNLVETDTTVIVPVGELLFDDLGNVVDEAGGIVRRVFVDDAEEAEFVEEQRLARLQVENRDAPTRTLVTGVDGVRREVDGTEAPDRIFIRSAGALRDAEGRPVEILQPVGVVGGALFDAFGNVVDEDGTVLVAVDEVRFDGAGNVVDEFGEVVVEFEDTEALDDPVVISRGVDGKLRDAAGEVVDPSSLQFEEDERVFDESQREVEVLDPIGGVGGILFDAFGNVVDEGNRLLVPVDEVQFDAAGNIIDESGGVVVTRREDIPDGGASADVDSTDGDSAEGDSGFGTGAAQPSRSPRPDEAVDDPGLAVVPDVAAQEVIASVQSAVDDGIEAASRFFDDIFGAGVDADLGSDADADADADGGSD